MTSINSEDNRLVKSELHQMLQRVSPLNEESVSKYRHYIYSESAREGLPKHSSDIEHSMNGFFEIRGGTSTFRPKSAKAKVSPFVLLSFGLFSKMFL